jgi:DNA-binding FadR family transcriptional regulator
MRLDRLNAKPDEAVFGHNLTFGLLNHLGLAIVAGEYISSAFPTEKELATRHGISRSVIREALKMLAAKGLLGSRPKLGTFVTAQEQWNLFDKDVLRWLFKKRPSFDLLRCLNEVRSGVEPHAAALSAKRADLRQRTFIAEALERVKAAKTKREFSLDPILDFHSAVLCGSGNPFFVQFSHIVAVGLRTSYELRRPKLSRVADTYKYTAVHNSIMALNSAEASECMRLLIVDGFGAAG